MIVALLVLIFFALLFPGFFRMMFGLVFFMVAVVYLFGPYLPKDEQKEHEATLPASTHMTQAEAFNLQPDRSSMSSETTPTATPQQTESHAPTLGEYFNGAVTQKELCLGSRSYKLQAFDYAITQSGGGDIAESHVGLYNFSMGLHQNDPQFLKVCASFDPRS